MLTDSDATVLITGKTGTGKVFVARVIHDYALASRVHSIPSTAPPFHPS
jgi:DNA-binding NtrC family response regulator